MNEINEIRNNLVVTRSKGQNGNDFITVYGSEVKNSIYINYDISLKFDITHVDSLIDMLVRIKVEKSIINEI